MENLLTLTAPTALLSGLFLITGCSSDDGGGSGATAVPNSAILIDNSNTAEATVTSAVATGIGFVSAFGVETSTPLTGKDIINLAINNIRNNTQNLPPIVSGVDLSSEICITGSASGTHSETLTSFSATATLNACEIASGIFFTGSLTLNSTFTEEPGPYSDSASGSLTVTFTGDSTSIGFNGFNYVESGDTSTGAYTVTTFTYAINPSTGGGFAVQVTQALIGNTNLSCELSQGQVLVSGASGSQARGTVNTDGTVTVEYHSGSGTFVETDNSPLPCLI